MSQLDSSTSYQIKIKKSGLGKRGVLFLLTFCLVVIMSAAQFFNGRLSVLGNGLNFKQAEGLSTTVLVDAFDVTQSVSYEGLPVASVVSYKVPDAQKTVVFIPQYHLNPSSEATDPINDSAERAQKEIYEVLTTLVDRADVELVMVEGELFGKVSESEVDDVAYRIGRRNALVETYQTLKEILTKDSLDSSLEQNLFAGIDRELAVIDRKIILEGAPIRLAAKRDSVRLWGLENEAAREESKLIVRDYVYLNDRIEELQKGKLSRKNQGQSTHLFQPGMTDLWQMLAGLNESPVEGSLRKLQKIASQSGRSDVVTLSGELERALNSLTEQPADQPSEVAMAVPGRQDNPYQNINNEGQLRQRLTEVEEEIEQTVVEKRNVETAKYVATVLQEQEESVGVVQFGAGHTEGLVKELNKQAISVVVVTPVEVANRTLGQ